MSGAEQGFIKVPGLYEALGVKPEPTAGLNGLQKAMLAMGMETPLKRSLFAAGVLSAAMWAVQPSASFARDGSTRSWGDGGVPWYIVPMMGVLIVQVIT